MQNTLQLYRNDQQHLAIPIDENTMFSQVVMGEHLITTQFISPVPLDIDEGDYILFRGERFTINRPLPPLDKTSLTEFTYQLTFEGYVYDLLDMPYMHLGALEFSYFGTPTMYLQILVDCMNSIGAGWTIGQVDDVEEQAIDFYESGKGFSCKGALIKIAEAFKLEFWLTGKTINLTAQAGVLTNITFEYGRGRGLYKISRGQIDDAAYFNRLYIQGSDNNIPTGYRNGAKRLQIDLPYLELPLTGGKKRRADSIVIDDVFPKRVGTITTVSADWLTITDTSIDFDLNGVRIEGQKATLEVTTGESAGQSFEIASYNHATKTVKIVPNTESDGYVRPNSTFGINAGDKYFFAGIDMPQTYIDAAELELKTRGIAILDKAKNNLPPYSVEVSDKFMRDNGITVNAGDRVGLKDTQIGVDAKIRVSSVKFPLVDPNSIQLVISDVIPLNNIEKTIVDVDKTKRDVVTVNKTNVELARRNALNLRSLENSIFDTDGMFDTDKLNVGVLKAALGIFGYESQNFVLSGVYVTDNYNDDPNSLHISGGVLSHLEVFNPGGFGDWTLSELEQAGLTPESLYYIYARCSKVTQTGTFVVTTDKITYDEDPSAYNFLVGVIYPVNAGYRDTDLSYGVASINGNRLKIGNIQSVDGLNFFNLSNGTFKLGNATSGLDFGITVEDELTIRGNLTARQLKTAITGARIEAVGNTISFYNSVGKLSRKQAIDENGNIADIWYNTNGSIARRQSVEAGVTKDVWNDANGNFVLELGQNGIVIVDNTVETFNDVEFLAVADISGNHGWQFTCNTLAGGLTTPFNCRVSNKTGRYLQMGTDAPVADGYYYYSTYEFQMIRDGYSTGTGNCSSGPAIPTVE